MLKQARVLFVDDEEHILNALRRGLIDEEYECFFASSGTEALSILEDNEICVVVTDMRMPGMDGLALLKHISLEYPHIVKLVLSGYAQLPQILATINQVDIFKFITKPWKMEEEFKGIIRQAIDYYNAEEERRELKQALESKNVAYQKILKNMDEVTSNSKKEAAHVKDLALLIFDRLHNQLEKKIADKEFVEMFINCRKLFGDYVDVFPFEAADCTYQEVLDHIAAYAKQFEKISTVDIILNTTAKAELKKCKGMLFYSLDVLFERIFFTSASPCIVKVLLDEKIHVGGNALVECTIVLSQADKGMTIPDELANKYNQQIEITKSFLGTILKYANIGFLMATAGNCIIAKYQFKQTYN